MAALVERLRQLKPRPATWFAAGVALIALMHVADERVVLGVTSSAIALTCSFGGLAVWPVYRRRQPQRVKRIRWLKGIFWFHVIGALVSSAYVAWAHYADIGDAYMTVVFVYLVGTLSLIASAIVQTIGKLATLDGRIAG